MSTLTRQSAIPYTGPAPTNRNPYVPADAPKMDARGAELAANLEVEQERGQDLPTFIVDKQRIVEVLRALKTEHRFTLPLDFWSGFVLEHRYHLSNQTLLRWVWRQIPHSW